MMDEGWFQNSGFKGSGFIGSEVPDLRFKG
jgi:hypothetical protein